MHQKTKMLARAALLAALTAVGAFIKIPLGYSSITLQFFFTAMAGCLLGPYWGAASQGVYVLLGLVGLPIFTLGGLWLCASAHLRLSAGAYPLGPGHWAYYKEKP